MKYTFPRNPIRIEITWERAKELLVQQGANVSEINEENDLNDFMGNGRTSFGTSTSYLTTQEREELLNAGFPVDYGDDIVLIVQKETYPGKYLIGEF